MGHAHRILPHYTYDDYLNWEGRWEIIDGIPYAMSPLPSPRHQRVASELNYLFVDALKKSGCKNCAAYDPLDFKIADETIIQPEVLIVCGKIQKKFLDFPPTLIVEILSPSTALRDRHTKFDLYELNGVKYYIMANPDQEVFEVYELINDKYVVKETIAGQLVTFSLEEDCRIEVKLHEAWN